LPQCLDPQVCAKQNFSQRLMVAQVQKANDSDIYKTTSKKKSFSIFAQPSMALIFIIYTKHLTTVIVDAILLNTRKILEQVL
jgi:hypothetical protein